MSKKKNKRDIIVALTVAGVCTVSGCKDRGNAETNAAPAAAEATSNDYATVVEMRHFDVYQRYSMMFDDVPGDIPVRLYSYDRDMQHAVMKFTGAGYLGGLSACSIGAVLTED